MMNDELKQQIVSVESTIENIKYYLQNERLYLRSDIISFLEDGISRVEPLLKYEEAGIKTLDQHPSEYIKFFKQKISEFQNYELFENIRYAMSLSEYDDETQEIIDECINSENIFDKLSLAIIYSKMGSDYYEQSARLFEEFLKTNPSNPCLTTQQILFYFAKLHEDNHKYLSSLDVYLKLLKIVPENPMIYKDVIRIFNKMGKQDLAKEALMSAKRTEFYKTDRCFKMIIDEI